MYRIPESVLVVVYSDDKKVLLLKRRQPFEFWQSVTGSLEQGESIQDAAQRELREETGLTNEGEWQIIDKIREFEIDPRWRDRYAPGVHVNTEHELHYRLGGAVQIELCDAEHSASRWFQLDDAIDTVWSWTNKEALMNLSAQQR